MMNEMIGYIFNKMGSSEKAINNLNNSMRKQRIINRVTATFLLTVTYRFIQTEINQQRLNKKVIDLSKEIEGLKQTEGE